ncbi:MAG: NUDIX domain-containing protein [Ferruginibacter sp.]
MQKRSAGIILYRFRNSLPEILLVHPGGPFWAKKDLGAWSIPKGDFDDNENPLDAAKREFEEETGIKIAGKFIELTPVKQKAGKLIYAWALQKDVNTVEVKSNIFEMQWPPKSGKMKEFPEIDKAEWFGIEKTKEKVLQGQLPLIMELMGKIGEAKC